MAEIVWTEEAKRWLEDIFEYIAAENPHAAGRTVQGIHERAQVLATFPRSAIATPRLRAMCASSSTGITELPIS